MNRKKVLAAVSVLAGLAILSLPFVGWQSRWYRDANEAPTEIWEPFIKQRPTLKIVYFNPLDCGACEERSLDDLDAGDRRELITVCHDRYGQTSISECIERARR